MAMLRECKTMSNVSPSPPAEIPLRFSTFSYAKPSLLPKLRHQNICHFYGYCINVMTSSLFTVVELASEGTLAEYLCLPSAVQYGSGLLNIALQVSRGLVYMHGKQYIVSRGKNRQHFTSFDLERKLNHKSFSAPRH